MAAAPQFGAPEPGRTYPDRPAAFVVVARDGLIAVVDVSQPDRGLDLPGGGLDPGEGARAAAARECAEEAGLIVELDPEPFVLADQYSVHGGRPVRTLGQFFAGRLVGEDPALKAEDDHTLQWMHPEAAIVRLNRDAHAWAVAAWLRRARRS